MNKLLKEGAPAIVKPENMGVVRAVRNLVKELEKVGADEETIEKAYSIEWDFVNSYGDDGIDDSMLVGESKLNEIQFGGESFSISPLKPSASSCASKARTLCNIYQAVF